MICSAINPTISLRDTIPSEAKSWRNQPEIRKWCRQFSLITDKDHENWLKSLETDKSIKMFGIFYNSDSASMASQYVGVCGLTSINRVNQTAEFSLYIAPGHQKKGYGERALLLLLMHGFDDQNLNRIWGESFDGNPAQNMFQRLGMKKEGTLRESYFRSGKFIDSHIWAMTRKEFNEVYHDRSSHGV